jgi:hypothetical protein
MRAIQALKHSYLGACDSKDPDRVRNCFRKDADIDFEGLGHFHDREEFVRYAGLALKKPDDARYAYNEMHVGHRGDITIVSDTEANGR